MKWDPTNQKFENWLASKFVNYKTMDIFTKGALWDYWKTGSDETEPTDENFPILRKNTGVDMELFTYDIERTENYDVYMNKFNDEFEEPWDDDGVPYKIGYHICEPFRFKNGETKWSTCISNEDGFCNGGELLGMV
ncbi:hypothetical protein Tco_1460343 [Tanacetum coccineum]